MSNKEPLADAAREAVRSLIENHMKSNSLSYRQLASQIGNGISPQTMSNWAKTGKVDPKYLPSLFNIIPVPADLRRAIMANRLGIDPETLDHAVGLSTGASMTETEASNKSTNRSPADTVLRLLGLASDFSVALQRSEVDDLNDAAEERLAELRKELGTKALPKPSVILHAEANEKRHAIGKVLGHEPAEPGPGKMIETQMLYENDGWDIEPPNAEEVRDELENFLERFPLLWQLSPAIRYAWVIEGLVVGAGRTIEEARADAELALDMTGEDLTSVLAESIETDPSTGEDLEDLPGTPVLILALSAESIENVHSVRANHDLVDSVGLELTMSGTEYRARAWEAYLEHKKNGLTEQPPTMGDLSRWANEPPIPSGALADLAAFNMWLGHSDNWRRADSDPHDTDAYVRYVPGRGRDVYKVMCTIDATDTEQFKHLSIQYIDPEGRMLESVMVPLLTTQTAIAACFAITPEQVEQNSRVVKRSTGSAVSIIVPLGDLQSVANGIAAATMTVPGDTPEA